MRVKQVKAYGFLVLTGNSSNAVCFGCCKDDFTTLVTRFAEKQKPGCGLVYFDNTNPAANPITKSADVVYSKQR